MIKSSIKPERKNLSFDIVPDLTPLLDIMFLLIIFLMLTINSVPKAFDIQLPEDTEKIAKIVTDDNTLKITVFSDNQGWGLDDRKIVEFKYLKSKILEKIDNNKKVIIYSDKTAEVEKLLNLLTFLQANNIETADIIME